MKNGEILLYQDADGKPNFEVILKNGTVWKTQAQIAQIFGADEAAIGLLIKKIYKTGELDRNATTADFADVQDQGSGKVAQSITHYNLDVILSVGFRVKSSRGELFRNWSTSQLSMYVIKGFVLDEARFTGDEELDE